MIKDGSCNLFSCGGHQLLCNSACNWSNYSEITLRNIVVEHRVWLFRSLVMWQLFVNHSEAPGCDYEGAGRRQGSSVPLLLCTKATAEEGCAGPCTQPVGMRQESLSPAHLAAEVVPEINCPAITLIPAPLFPAVIHSSTTCQAGLPVIPAPLSELHLIPSSRQLSFLVVFQSSSLGTSLLNSALPPATSSLRPGDVQGQSVARHPSAGR